MSGTAVPDRAEVDQNGARRRRRGAAAVLRSVAAELVDEWSSAQRRVEGNDASDPRAARQQPGISDAQPRQVGEGDQAALAESDQVKRRAGMRAGQARDLRVQEFRVPGQALVAA